MRIGITLSQGYIAPSDSWEYILKILPKSEKKDWLRVFTMAISIALFIISNGIDGAFFSNICPDMASKCLFFIQPALIL